MSSVKLLIAHIIDLLLIALPGFVWMVVFGRVHGFQDEAWGPTKNLLLKVIVGAGIFYLLVFLAVQIKLIFKGRQTIGKKLLGIK